MAFVYLTRLYINKTALSAIPKSWLPIQKGDVRLPVWKMINSYLSRSAAISFASRPRTKREAGDSTAHLPESISASFPPKRESVEDRRITMQRTPSDSPFLNNHQAILEIPFSSAAIWDDIEHPGWSSPNSPEMPDVQYSVVYGEIPDMIEAKAFTLAQTGPNSGSTPSVLHSGLQEVLARPSNMSLRDYITHLSNYNVITQSATVSSFLTNYERAKYSTRPLPGAQFREMMAQFAQILQSMQPLDLTSRETASLFRYDDDDTSLHSSLAFGSHSFHYANNSAERSLGSEPSIRSSLSASPSFRAYLGSSPPSRSGSIGAASYLTAPATPQKRSSSIADSSSIESLSPSPYPLRASRMASPASMHSRSSYLSSSGSVVHKATILQP
ncbi:hypothetical protein HOO65_010708 [Ceratocystis lukuohia]|uniref:Defect at low temperature protein 1 n=1 Tax=Ceratocystis lukuohia TaxID=2019550 RepID=A0ABR4MSV3_9PEZI